MKIGQHELDIISKTTVGVFEIVERAWSTQDCSLIDMKIEFGVDLETGNALIEFVLNWSSIIHILNLSLLENKIGTFVI